MPATSGCHVSHMGVVRDDLFVSHVRSSVSRPAVLLPSRPDPSQCQRASHVDHRLGHLPASALPAQQCVRPRHSGLLGSVHAPKGIHSSAPCPPSLLPHSLTSFPRAPDLPHTWSALPAPPSDLPRCLSGTFFPPLNSSPPLLTPAQSSTKPYSLSAPVPVIPHQPSLQLPALTPDTCWLIRVCLLSLLEHRLCAGGDLGLVCSTRHLRAEGGPRRGRHSLSVC